MTVLQNTLKLTAATALLVVMAAGNAASAAEKLVGTYGEQRTVLAFRLPDTAAQKLLPEGWQVSLPSTGPSKDSNLNVVFVDALTVQNPDATSGETFRIVGLVVPAKKKGTDAVVPMVVGGFASTPSFVPGPYGNADLASATIDRHAHTDPTGKTNVEESWEFKGNGGDAIGLHLQYDRGVAARSKAEVMPHSGVKPDFYRIYRIEQAAGAQHCNQHRPRAEICVQRHRSEVDPAV